MSIKMQIGGWVALAAVALGALGVAKTQYDARIRAEATIAVRDSVFSVRITRFSQTLDSLKLVAERESTEVVRYRGLWATATAAFRVDTVTRTVTIPELVPGPVVREIVRVGDSTITACQLALDTCRRRLTLAVDSVNTEWQQRFESVRGVIPKPPSTATQILRTGEDLAAVYGIVRLVLHLFGK